MEVLETGVHVSVILTALGGLFVFAVVKPLNNAINELRTLIAEVRADLKSNNERVHRLEGEIREMKYAVQKAHDRIDASLKEKASHASKN